MLLLGFGALGALVVPYYQIERHGDGAQVAQMAALIRREMHGGCLYVYEGEPVLYRETGSCLPSRYAFPNHLNTWTEAKALGVDVNQETARILASEPDVVVIGANQRPYLPNYVTRTIVTDALAHDYERFATFTLGDRPFDLYRRKPEPARPAAPEADLAKAAGDRHDD